MAERLTLTDAQVNEAFEGIVANERDEVRAAFDDLTYNGQRIDIYVNSSNPNRRRRTVEGTSIVASASRHFRKQLMDIIGDNPDDIKTTDRRKVKMITDANNGIQVFFRPLSEGAREIIGERDTRIPHPEHISIQPRIIHRRRRNH